MEGRHGVHQTAVCGQIFFRTSTPSLVNACTRWRNRHKIRIECSCRIIGASTAVMTEASTGRMWQTVFPRISAFRSPSTRAIPTAHGSFLSSRTVSAAPPKENCVFTGRGMREISGSPRATGCPRTTPTKQSFATHSLSIDWTLPAFTSGRATESCTALPTKESSGRC